MNNFNVKTNKFTVASTKFVLKIPMTRKKMFLLELFQLVVYRNLSVWDYILV